MFAYLMRRLTWELVRTLIRMWTLRRRSHAL
jgi:hypothetical protein